MVTEGTYISVQLRLTKVASGNQEVIIFILHHRGQQEEIDLSGKVVGYQFEMNSSDFGPIFGRITTQRRITPNLND